jgi:hypothetical protein
MGLILETKKSLIAGKRGANNDDNNQPNKAGNQKQAVPTDRKLLKSPIHFFHAWGACCLFQTPKQLRNGWNQACLKSMTTNPKLGRQTKT